MGNYLTLARQARRENAPRKETATLPCAEEPVVLHPGHPLLRVEWGAVFPRPTTEAVQHKRPGCSSRPWWEHVWGGRYCSECWPCTDSTMFVRGGPTP